MLLLLDSLSRGPLICVGAKPSLVRMNGSLKSAPKWSESFWEDFCHCYREQWFLLADSGVLKFTFGVTSAISGDVKKAHLAENYKIKKGNQFLCHLRRHPCYLLQCCISICGQTAEQVEEETNHRENTQPDAHQEEKSNTSWFLQVSSWSPSTFNSIMVKGAFDSPCWLNILSPRGRGCLSLSEQGQKKVSVLYAHLPGCAWSFLQSREIVHSTW